MKYPFAFAVLALLFAACGGNTWKKSEGMAFDFEYQLFNDGNTKPKIDFGDSVLVHYALRNGDKIIISSYETGSPVLVGIPAKMHRNCFEDALTLAAEGDSIAMQIEIDKAGEALQQYKTAFKSGEKPMFTYNILKVKTRQQNEAERETQYAAEMGFASVDALRTEKEYLKTLADSIPRFMSATAQLHKDKELTGLQKSTEDIEFLLLDKGNEKPLQTGDTLFLHFAIQLYTDGKIIDNTFKTAHRYRYIMGAPNTLVPMWALGLSFLNHKGKALFIVPPALGYGAEGSLPTVPQNATLLWYVEIMN